MVSSEPSEVVRNGYDAIAARHLAWIGEIHGDPRLRFLDELQRWLPDGADVVDLGCGAGVPCTKLLAKRHSGFDLLVDEVVTMQEPEGPVTFLWILGQKRSAVRGQTLPAGR